MKVRPLPDPMPATSFLAVLIFEDGPGRRCEEPRVYPAAHPEIAYQLALADGNEQRYGRRFLGLSHLEESTDDVPQVARTQGGDAAELVVEKEMLAAFQDPRWAGVPCDPERLAAALRGPPALFDVEGLDAIPWHTYSHAYGPATDVPKDIRRLASSDADVRDGARWRLGGSVYHQGTLYPAAAVAVPFLVRLAADPRLPDRAGLLGLLEAIAESAAVDPDKLRQAWAWRQEHFGEIYAKTTAEMAEAEVASFRAVLETLLARRGAIETLGADDDPAVAKAAAAVLAHLARVPR
jgi:hypothetical protein